MSANNTSAFNCRNVPHTIRWSRHSYGKAIDINPVYKAFIEKKWEWGGDWKHTMQDYQHFFKR